MQGANNSSTSMLTTHPTNRYAFLEQSGQSTVSSQQFAFNSMHLPSQSHQQLMQTAQSGVDYYTSIQSQSGPVKNGSVDKHATLCQNIKNELTENIELGKQREAI